MFENNILRVIEKFQSIFILNLSQAIILLPREYSGQLNGRLPTI